MDNLRSPKNTPDLTLHFEGSNEIVLKHVKMEAQMVRITTELADTQKFRFPKYFYSLVKFICFIVILTNSIIHYSLSL